VFDQLYSCTSLISFLFSFYLRLPPFFFAAVFGGGALRTGGDGSCLGGAAFADSCLGAAGCCTK